MVDDGQFGFGMMLALCLLAGALLGIVALAARRPPAAAPSRVSRFGGDSAPELDEKAQVPPPVDASPIASGGAGDDQEDGKIGAR
jgi:hypothetical protein